MSAVAFGVFHGEVLAGAIRIIVAPSYDRLPSGRFTPSRPQAMESARSERPDALFRDPFARRLAGERGARITEGKAFANRNPWSFVARTVVFDRFIGDAVANVADMVVNLAAGLDTRPYRMTLPSDLGSKSTCRICSPTRPNSSLVKRRAASWSAWRSTCRTSRPAASCSND